MFLNYQIVSSPCPRQHEHLSPLFVRRLLPFYILIFSCENRLAK
jgi:hypothetical protein